MPAFSLFLAQTRLASDFRPAVDASYRPTNCASSKPTGPTYHSYMRLTRLQ